MRLLTVILRLGDSLRVKMLRQSLGAALADSCGARGRSVHRLDS